MTDDTAYDRVDANVLLPRLRLIEDQPLASRAEAFVRVHDELQSVLERGDAQQRSDTQQRSEAQYRA
jgi:hypothetical protein